MAAKVVKLTALPAALGLASCRVYAMTEEKSEEQISPRELSIYNPEPPMMRYVEESGYLQTGLGRVRLGLQPYVRTVQSSCTSVKVGVMSLYQAGHDTYEFLRDPPPGFLPRVGVITVSGLAGLILARKGSRIRRIGLPLALATVGTAVCYPTQTVGVLKFTGKKAYSASSLVASVFKSNPKKDAIDPSASLEAVTPKFATASKTLLESQQAEVATGEEAPSDVSPTMPDIMPALTGAAAPSAPETQPAVVDEVAESGLVSLPEIEPTSDFTSEDTVLVYKAASVEDAPLTEDASEPDDASENVSASPEGEPTDDAPISEAAKVTLAEVPEDATILEFVPMPDVTPDDVTPVSEVMPVEDAQVVKVAPPPDVAPEEVRSADPVAPLADTAPIPSLIPEEVATVSEKIMASEFILGVGASPVAEAALLPVEEQINPTEDTQTAKVTSAETASAADTARNVQEVAAVDEALSESAIALGEPDQDAAPSPLPQLLEPEGETAHQSIVATELVSDFEAVTEASPEATDPVSEPVPTIPVPVITPDHAEKAVTLSPPSAEAMFSLTALEETIPVPLSVEEPRPPPPSFKEPSPLSPSAEEPSPLSPTVEETSPPPSSVEEPSPLPPSVEEPSPLPPSAEEPSPLPPSAEEPSPLLPSAEEPSPLSPTVEETSPPPPSVEEPSPLPPSAEEPSPLLPSAEEPSPLSPTVEETSPLPSSVEEISPPPSSVEEPSPPPSSAEEPSPPPSSAEEPSPPPSAEETSPPPSSVEEPSPPPSSAAETSPLSPVEGTTCCPSTTDETASVPLVIDKAPLIHDATESPAEVKTTSPPPATEDATVPLTVVDEAIQLPPAVEETTPPPALEETPTVSSSSVKEKPRFVPDPSLVDHGQAHPDDADMYSTRG